MAIEYLRNHATAGEIADHLVSCDADFVPPLSARLDIASYAGKIAVHAARFEAWSDRDLIGLVAAYCNDPKRSAAYITSVSVSRAWTGKGIAAKLLALCIAHASALGMREVTLEVASDNTPAISLYEKSGFVRGETRAPFIRMNLILAARGEHEQHA